jgi:plastocyanin
MKKILLLLFCLIYIKSNATTWTVNVQDFQFSPSTLNVSVGDVIHWVWLTGTHTTTSVTTPVGAATWNSPMDSTHTTFDYTITKPGAYSYQCNFHAFLGMTATFTTSGALPIILSNFVIGTQNSRPFISWSTQTEVNADYFSIRKSVNGTDFYEIGKVPATGNSQVERKYSFIDEAISSAVTYVYYSLAIVDMDGNTKLSPIRIYKNLLAAPKLIISLSPNPIQEMGHLSIQYNANKKGTMLAKIINSDGKLILQASLSADLGINNGHIHLMNIPAGIYVINFNLEGLSESYTIVKN